MKPAVLFVDLLGARNKWQTGGVASATKAFNHFSRMVIRSLGTVDPKAIIDGGIETDAAMFSFESAFVALQVARTLFQAAFKIEKDSKSPRLWLRGSLVLGESGQAIRKESHPRGPLSHLGIVTYSKPALDAISIEKSGFKGMRLLVMEDVVDDDLWKSLTYNYDNYYFSPIKILKYSSHPKVKKNFYDFLWMVHQDESMWRELDLYMTYRLRYSANNPEEFAQAAATQVVFHECTALRQGAISSAKRMNGESIVKKDDPND